MFGVKGPWEEGEDADDMWLKMATCVRKVASEVFGVSRVLKSDRTGLTAALRYRFTGPVRPVTGGNRLNSNPNSNKFKFSRATGSDRFTGRFYRFTGRFDRFEIQIFPCNRF